MKINLRNGSTIKIIESDGNIGSKRGNEQLKVICNKEVNNMIVYRPHRGSLADAMKEAKEFNNEQEMKEFIVKQWDGYFDIDDISIEETPVNDDRNGWKDTRYVCIKRFGEEDNIALYGVPQCIGMCATEY